MPVPPLAPSRLDQHIGQRIRDRRQALGFSREDLAVRVVLSPRLLETYERGLVRVPSGRLFDLATALGVGVSHFFDGCGPSLMEAQRTIEQRRSGLARALADLGGDDMLRAILRLLRLLRKCG